MNDQIVFENNTSKSREYLFGMTMALLGDAKQLYYAFK